MKNPLPKRRPKLSSPPRPTRRAATLSPFASKAFAIFSGRVIGVDEDRAKARVDLEDGRRIEARLPQHVSADWLRAAVRLAPVDAAVAVRRDGAVLWCLLPGPEHAPVRVDVELSGPRVLLHASERLEIRCSKGTVIIDEQGNVTVRGKELLSRASEANRIQGGTIRLN